MALGDRDSQGGCRKLKEERWCGVPFVVHKRLNMCCCMDVSLRHLFIAGFRIYLANVFNVRITRTAATRVCNTLYIQVASWFVKPDSRSLCSECFMLPGMLLIYPHRQTSTCKHTLRHTPSRFRALWNSKPFSFKWFKQNLKILTKAVFPGWELKNKQTNNNNSECLRGRIE